MRITGGTLRGRTIRAKSFDGRPTMDRAREALFNILDHRLDYAQCDVADLFAGTGAVGFEFASRGARMVTSVEISARHAAAIEGNAQELGLENFRVVRAPLSRYLRNCPPHDVAFADPPYGLPWLPELPELLLKSTLLRPDGLLIIEHPNATEFLGQEPLETRCYGDSCFSFFHSGKGK